MSEIRERKDQDSRYTWDLSDLYVSDSAWEEDFGSIDSLIGKAASHSGKLSDAPAIRAFLEDEFILICLWQDILHINTVSEMETLTSRRAHALDGILNLTAVMKDQEEIIILNCFNDFFNVIR